MSSPSIAFQQRARLSTTAAIAPTQPLQAAAAAAISAPKMSKFGAVSKIALLGTATIALGAAAAVQLRANDESVVAAQNKAKKEADKRYQELLNAYGSGETLEDLQNAVSSYGGPQSRG